MSWRVLLAVGAAIGLAMAAWRAAAHQAAASMQPVQPLPEDEIQLAVVALVAAAWWLR